MDQSFMSLSIAPLDLHEIGAALLCGAILGFERQLKGKPAGIRTSTLICLGTYVFVKIGFSIHYDPTGAARTIGQVITGIGFLGAGVILAREGMVLGVTSAAVIWLLAALGVTIGSGYPVTAIVVTVLAIIILIGVDLLERWFKELRRGVHSQLSKRQHNRSSGSE
ncbi:MAG TPA: MgtC/SapB family protein [Gammaproteobacteria bacterium]|nr:MgtC/SapB family protein [Gammaproteobacteria bacterium]